MTDTAVSFEQDADGLHVKLAEIGRLRVVDCATIDDWGDDVIVLLRCTTKPADPAAAEPDRWRRLIAYNSGESLWVNQRGERKRIKVGEEP